MRERRYVKFRVDMYDDTKFKIIDMKPERDVIHYIWSRIVLLAGKVNLEGNLYLSKSIPYTIETLAIEFNRDIAQIKLAIDLFIELEMIELTEDKVYRVKNFAKHQNIKVNGKEIAKNKEEDIKNTYVPQSEDFKEETNKDIVKESDNKTIENVVENAQAAKGGNFEIIKVDKIIEDKQSRDNLHKGIPMILETNKKKNKKQKEEIANFIDSDEEIKEESICLISEGIRPLGKDESKVFEMSFG